MGYDYSSTADSGNAFLYTLSDGTWTNLLATTAAPAPQANAGFGNAVALSATHALIGASGYDYTPSNGITVSDSGNAFIYYLSGGGWIDLLDVTEIPPTPQASAQFGASVALSPTHALVGAPNYSHQDATNSGNAYLYQISDSAWTWTDLLEAMGAPATQANAGFGASVALNSSHALIGAVSYNSPTVDYTGNAFLYTISSGTWINLLGSENAPTLQAASLFGLSVALSSNYALIGAHTNDFQSTTRSGKAFLYNITSGAWNNLLANNSAPADQGPVLQSGVSVALSATHALVGTHTNDFGNVYLFSFLPNSDTTYDAVVDPTTFPALLANSNVTFTATNSITVLSSIDLSSYTGSNTLTLTAPNIDFQLSDATSVVGSSSNSVVVSTPSGSWTPAHLILPTNGTTYLATPHQGALESVVAAQSPQGLISITQTVGDILLNNDITAPNLSLSITVPGSLNFGTITITVANLSISAGTIITGAINAGTNTDDMTNTDTNTDTDDMANTDDMNTTNTDMNTNTNTDTNTDTDDMANTDDMTSTNTDDMANTNTDMNTNTNTNKHKHKHKNKNKHSDDTQYDTTITIISFSAVLNGSNGSIATNTTIKKFSPDGAKKSAKKSSSSDKLFSVLIGSVFGAFGGGCDKGNFLSSSLKSFSKLCGAN